MPAIMDDPDTPTIYRVSGEPPYPDPALPVLPPSIEARQVTLRDRQTIATIVPFASRYQVPDSLLRYLNDQFNKEIEGGDTYPMMEGLSFEKFASYWFQNFAAIMLLGDIASADEVVEGKDWSKECLGTFYIKPNYPGRSSHVCNAGFIVTDASRNRGVGRLLGESYLVWAPKLGYSYSVFNLVYETNVASCKIWDALGFKRIGRVKGCGNLKSYPGRLIDAIIYGRDLADDNGGTGGDDLVSEERFDKIKFYLKTGQYPNGCDRAEKSRLRSAATHYKLVNDILMLKDKEVIADAQRQYDIARSMHNQAHAGINKTTAIIAERYHWSRIKETVTDVIKNCGECKEQGKTTSLAPPLVKGIRSGTVGTISSKRPSQSPSAAGPGDIAATAGSTGIPIPETDPITPFSLPTHHYTHDGDIAIMTPSHTLQATVQSAISDHDRAARHNPMLQDHSSLSLSGPHSISVYQPIDPQIISQPSTDAHHHHHHHHPLHHYSFHHNPHAHDPDADTFQALLNATDDIDPSLHAHDDEHHHHHSDTHQGDANDVADQDAVDRDLEMLIEPQDDDDDVQADSGMDVDMDNVNPITSKAANAKMDVNHLLSSHEEDEEDPRDGSVTGRKGDRPVYDVGFDGGG